MPTAIWARVSWFAQHSPGANQNSPNSTAAVQPRIVSPGIQSVRTWLLITLPFSSARVRRRASGVQSVTCASARLVASVSVHPRRTAR